MSRADMPQPRVVVRLRHETIDRAIIDAAAELARMLDGALHGVFLEEAALPGLAELGFIREFRLASGAWQPLDRHRIAEEQRRAAQEAERLLDEAAAAFGIQRLFETVGGDPARFLAATAQAGDIIVVAQPRLPVERLVHATAHWLKAAHDCAASVMLVPQAMARRSGPVAAVVCADSDPAPAVAARIAVATDEPLVLLLWGTPSLAAAAVERARAAGLPPQRIVTRAIGGLAPGDVLAGLGSAGERLVVLARGACGADDAAISAHIAAARGVPVLVVEHGHAGGAIG
jgi:hypothetical protein